MKNTDKNSNQTINLFKNIAITFSGGGYRASTFALGTLSYFNHVQFNGKPLLQNVKGLSTVSGGTLTGATYAHFIAEGKDFDAFYTHFYNMLNDDKLIGLALKKLGSDKIWKNSHKKRSLINAFALTYTELLSNENFQFLKDNKSHLEDICFNATDFSFGLAFRFQTKGDYGNYRLKCPKLNTLANEFKLADAIASSSCFPIGFAPLIMPDDYIANHESELYLTVKNHENFKEGVGIMDGGIVDNQGIGSIMNADKRRENKYDLIMICDVGSYFMDPWEPGELVGNEKLSVLCPKSLFKRVEKIIKSTWWLWVSILTCIGLLLFGFLYKPNPLFFIFGGAMGALGIAAILLKILIEKFEDTTIKVWGKLLNIVPKFMQGKLKNFEELKLQLLVRMIEERGTSGMKLINDIFLKQIRRLNYNLFYTDDNLKNRRITSLIYELTKDQYKFSKSDEKGVEEKIVHINNPGDRIFAAAQIARKMPTTLWFSEADKEVQRLKNLVSCGQFTTCYNLLKYCYDLKKSDVNVDSKLLDKMIEVFRADWNEFIKDPYWLHDRS